MQKLLLCEDRTGGGQPVGRVKALLCVGKRTGGSELRQIEKEKRRMFIFEYNWENTLK